MPHTTSHAQLATYHMSNLPLTIISARWWFPGGPVGSDGPGSKPLPVHEGDCVLGLNLLGEGHEPVTFALQGLGIANHSAVAES